MSCTSPGQQINNSINNNNNNNNSTSSNNNNNNNSECTTNVQNAMQFFRNGLHNQNDNELFDESLDGLDDWPSPMRLVRSRSWFCCANEKSERAEQPSIRSRPLSCRYSIVRTEPKPQSHIVGNIVKSKTNI